MGKESSAFLREYVDKLRAVESCQDAASPYYHTARADVKDMRIEAAVRADELEKFLRQEFCCLPRGVTVKDTAFGDKQRAAFMEWLEMAGILPEKNQQNLADLIASARGIMSGQT